MGEGKGRLGGGVVGESFVMSYCAKEVLMEMKKLIIKCDQEEVFTVQVIVGMGECMRWGDRRKFVMSY